MYLGRATYLAAVHGLGRVHARSDAGDVARPLALARHEPNPLEHHQRVADRPPGSLAGSDHAEGRGELLETLPPHELAVVERQRDEVPADDLGLRARRAHRQA